MATKEVNGPRISEAQIKLACVELLQSDGWWWLETDSPRARGLGVAQEGIADALFLRFESGGPRAETIPELVWCQHLFVEFKRKKGRHSEKQRLWQQHMKKLGGFVVKFGDQPEDTCPASIEGFTEWYLNSGLNRRIMAR